MSPALNGSFALQRFTHGNVIKLCNGILFNFYPGLPHKLPTPFHSLYFLLRYPASSSTKLLCFSRSSPLIHQLPVQYPSSGQAATIVEQTFCDLVSPNSCQLVLYKLSSLLSQSRLQEMLREFVQSNTAKVSFHAWMYTTTYIHPQYVCYILLIAST